MKSTRKLGYIAVAWLCLCLILLFAASCSTLQNAGPEHPAAYRITLNLPINAQPDLQTALTDSQPMRIEYEGSLVTVTFHTEQAVTHFRQNLQNTGVPIHTLQIEKINL